MLISGYCAIWSVENNECKANYYDRPECVRSEVK